jgi:hypothetical protein
MHGIVIFGEVYGSNVQDMTYGASPGELKFACFDLYNGNNGKFADDEILEKMCKKLDIPTTPLLYDGKWLGFDKHKPLAEENSKLYDGLSEGFVARPKVERYIKSGRVVYKIHSERFLLR